MNKPINSISPISPSIQRKSFGNPVIISSDLEEFSCLPLPKILRINTKSKILTKKSKISDQFVSKIDHQLKSSSNITIGAPIIPKTAGLKEKTKKSLLSSEIRISDEVNESLTANDSSVESTQNDIAMQIDANRLPHFYSLRNKVICVMESQCKFAFHGKLKIKVLYGAVKIYGTTVSSSNSIIPLETYSPRGNNLVDIQATILKNSSDDSTTVWNKLKMDNIDCHISNALQSDVNNLKLGWAVLMLQNFENKLTTFLEMNCNYKLFPKIDDTSNYSWLDVKRAEIVLQTNIYNDYTAKPTINFNVINQIADKILIKHTNDENLRVIVAGGKSVGKSTSMRYFVNRLLEKYDSVIVLDLDPGQSEFTPPGCISMNIIKCPLLGPNFTHLKQPYYHIYTGSADVTRYLSLYMNGVKKLVKCLNEYTTNNISLPIVVNTMGFCRGVGWDIITSTIKCIQPTDVVQIVSERPKNNFDQFLNHEIINNQHDIWAAIKNSSENPETFIVKYEHHIVNSQAENKNAFGDMWNIEPHQKREIAWLAYLSAINKYKNNIVSCDDNDKMNINSIVPYQVPFSAIKLSLDHSVTPYSLSVMNGNIVALCGIDYDEEQEQSSEEHSQSYPEVLIRSPLATCYGFGILRGVDMEQEKLYINTPLSISELKYVNCFIGCTAIPSGLLQLNKTGLPYTGGDYNLPTSRDPRRGYFRMKYRNDT